MMPVIDVPSLAQKQAAAEPQYAPSIRFDFKTGDFVITPKGRLELSTGKEAYIQWCQKQLHTERFSHSAYTADIGVELETAMHQPTEAAVRSAIERTITEALLVNKKTEYVSRFEIKRAAADALSVNFTVRGIDTEEIPVSTTIAVG